MAIACPRCGAGYDVTLFQFGHRVRCTCGQWVDLASGHTRSERAHPIGRSTMAEQEVGRVTHYFGKIHVAAVEVTHGTLSVGDTIHIKGHTSDFTQTVDSMQIDGQEVDQTTAGQNVGLVVADHAREHDMVYKTVD